MTFHPGETRIQERAGEHAIATRNGRMLKAEIPRGAIPFLAGQQMLVVGYEAPDGSVQASLLFGRHGFANAPTPGEVTIDRTRVISPSGDDFWASVGEGSRVGLLAIELESRRRLRINGVATALDRSEARFRVAEAYPNCPKFIEPRLLAIATSPAGEPDPIAGGSGAPAFLDDLLPRTDTLFVASGHPKGHLDVSHRGGPRGFARSTDTGRILIPDYRGNSMFNTLGNLDVDPAAGLVIPDFERGRLIHLTGTTELIWDDPDLDWTQGTGRAWQLVIASWRDTPMPPGVAFLPVR